MKETQVTMTVFEILKLITLDKEAEALSSASASVENTADELSEEELDLLSAAGQKPLPPGVKPFRYG